MVLLLQELFACSLTAQEELGRKALCCMPACHSKHADGRAGALDAGRAAGTGKERARARV